MKTQGNKYSLDKICILGETSKRTFRYYIQEGLIDKPEGESKRSAFYTNHHLEQLLSVRKYRQAGLSINRIREIVQSKLEFDEIPESFNKRGSIEIWSRIYINAGIQININPEKAGISPEQFKSLTHKILELFSDIKGMEE